jgi:hypothetical protein
MRQAQGRKPADFHTNNLIHAHTLYITRVAAWCGLEDGMKAWFVCRAGKVADDVELRLRDGIKMPADEALAKRGRIRAARVFKARHGLHPCTRVEVEFMGVEGEGK